MDVSRPPIFTAVSSSTRQLSLLLRCIGFWRKAEVQITSEGLRFSVEESRTVQGITFLEKTLFSSYTFNSASIDDSASQDEVVSAPCFQINLSALLEVLQIFGVSDVTSSRHPTGGFTSTYTHNAFNTPALAIAGGTCRISYPHVGAPISITISEAGVTTTCDLNTYESSNGTAYDIDESIPLQRDALTFKLIMKSAGLHDAIAELASENPTKLILTASEYSPPYFALEGSGGPFGDAIVDFQPFPANDRNAVLASMNGSDQEEKKKVSPQVAEIFTVLPHTDSQGRVRHRYKFEHIQKAARAMGSASKVCIRCDGQGVLSLQFMVELDSGADGTGAVHHQQQRQQQDRRRNGSASAPRGPALDSESVSFVDFRFVPLVDDKDEDEGEAEGGG